MYVTETQQACILHPHLGKAWQSLSRLGLTFILYRFVGKLKYDHICESVVYSEAPFRWKVFVKRSLDNFLDDRSTKAPDSNSLKDL